MTILNRIEHQAVVQTTGESIIKNRWRAYCTIKPVRYTVYKALAMSMK
jgi:hypothetical protein